MKMSCNGCRILRKGCTDNCVIRPCIEWINSPESQANATLFLAKFYGRTALLNLISAAPHHLRPAVFRSLLHEACGRLVNPTYGSIGLFWTGEWARCEAAVDAVLSGSPINGVANFYWQETGSLGDDDHVPRAYDIRHVPRVTDVGGMGERTRRKRLWKVMRPKPRVGSLDSTALWKPSWDGGSMETMEPSLVSEEDPNRAAETGLSLELSLGFSCQSTSGRKKYY